MARAAVSLKNVKVVQDKLPELIEAVEAMTKKEVLVGVPGSTSPRGDDSGFTNAAIGYIAEYGSPARNIPARPWLGVSIEGIKDQINQRFRAMAQAALDGNLAKVKSGLEAVGLLAQNAAQNKVRQGPFVPLAESTIEARARRGRKGAKIQLARMARGMAFDPALTRPLIDTGAFLQSISYVVREKREAAES